MDRSQNLENQKQIGLSWTIWAPNASDLMHFFWNYIPWHLKLSTSAFFPIYSSINTTAIENIDELIVLTPSCKLHDRMIYAQIRIARSLKKPFYFFGLILQQIYSRFCALWKAAWQPFHFVYNPFLIFTVVGFNVYS